MTVEPGNPAPEMPDEQYPELARQSFARDHLHSHALGEFLEWLQEVKGLVLCHMNEVVESYNGVGHPSTNETIEQILADYHGIDRDKIEQERRQLLESLG